MTSEGWQVVEVTGVGVGELWFDSVDEEISQRHAERVAQADPRYIAIPMPADSPDDWGEQWLNDELDVDDYASAE